jgi:hypothetical protein
MLHALVDIEVYFVEKFDCKFKFLLKLLQEPLLQSLNYLPNVVRLQQLLVKHYTSKLDYAEAAYISISDAIEKIPDGNFGIFISCSIHL